MSIVSQPIDRTDGPLKVKGEARYAAEFHLPRVAHGVLVTSTVAKGTISSLDEAVLRRAADAALARARPYKENVFKVELARRAIVRAALVAGGVA